MHLKLLSLSQIHILLQQNQELTIFRKKGKRPLKKNRFLY